MLDVIGEGLKENQQHGKHTIKSQKREKKRPLGDFARVVGSD